MGFLNPADATAKPNTQNMQQEIETLAYRISSYLHYSIKTQACVQQRGYKLCDMCLNASRLCIQELVPMVAEEMLTKIERSFGRRCRVPHPGSDD